MSTPRKRTRRSTGSNEIGLALARLRAARSHLAHARHGCTLSQDTQDALTRRLLELADVEVGICSDVARALDDEAARKAKR